MRRPIVEFLPGRFDGLALERCLRVSSVEDEVVFVRDRVERIGLER
jgi:hypothetical protein